MTKKMIIGFLIVLVGGIALLLYNQEDPRDAHATTCFKTGERTSGMNKICYYDCLGSEAAITISSVELCPLSIDR
jgi:hypothetical protein